MNYYLNYELNLNIKVYLSIDKLLVYSKFICVWVCLSVYSKTEKIQWKEKIYVVSNYY